MSASDDSYVITIDGPAGSGKSTVSGLLARRLNAIFLTTGAFYRGLALLCLEKKVDVGLAENVALLAQYEDFKVTADPQGTQVFIDGVNVTERLANEQTARTASLISAYPEVREALLNSQRLFKKKGNLIAEGRDCGTVVYPEAAIKIFLTASLDQRAQRRSVDDKSATSQEHFQNIARRDRADSERDTAPLQKAKDAHEINTSNLSAEQVVDKIEKIVKQKLRAKR